jgi:hypothetical protein
MNDKKVLFISYGVGGAEAIYSVYPYLKNEYKDVRNITITPFAKTKVNDSTYIDENLILDYIRKEKPDVLINERSNGLVIQNKITNLCRELGILNIALLDFYGKYTERFEAVPDIIISPSKSITDEMIDDGFAEGSIVTAGNPAFDRLDKYKSKKSRNNTSPKIVFMSQPLRETDHLDSQYDIFNKFILELTEVYDHYKIDVKVHPNENIKEWQDFVENLKDVNVLNVGTAKDFLEEVSEYDLVAGYNSTLMLQTYMMGIPTIYYEMEGTKEALINFKNGSGELQYIKYGDFEKNSIDKVLKVIKNLI